MPNVRLERHIDISAYGSEVMTVGDINGDGALELVFMQNVGMLTLDMFKPGGTTHYGKLYTTPDDQALDCVTAIDLTGRILWQQGQPWKKPIPFRTHGGGEMITTEDIDGDGRNELLRIKGDVMEVMDGTTGRVLHSASLGAHGHSSIFTAKVTPDSNKRHILVKPCSDGMPGHPYGCPVLLLDDKLRTAWGPKDFRLVGHTPVAFDVDGDGRDEILIGADCVNPDGSLRWSLPLSLTHDDRRYIHDIDGDGEPEQILAFESHGLVVSDLRGNIKFTRDSDHCGEAVVGKFFDNLPGLQILFNNETWRLKDSKHAFGSMMIDCKGNELWRTDRDLYGRPIDWRTSVGPQAILAKPHAAAPPDGRPFIMDGTGKTLAEFDIPLYADRMEASKLPHDRPVAGDWGDYYSYRSLDVPGVGPRILIWTRKDLWVFKAEV